MRPYASASIVMTAWALSGLSSALAEDRHELLAHYPGHDDRYPNHDHPLTPRDITQGLGRHGGVSVSVQEPFIGPGHLPADTPTATSGYPEVIDGLSASINPLLQPSVALKVDVSTARTSLEFLWPEPVGAAVFTQNGTVWIVFDRSAPIDLSALQSSGLITGSQSIEGSDYVALRLEVRGDVVVSSTRRGSAWAIEMSPGKVRSRTAQRVLLSTRISIAGSTRAVSLTDPLTDQTFVVVTSSAAARIPRGSRRRGVTIPQTAQGLVATHLSPNRAVRLTPDHVAFPIVRRDKPNAGGAPHLLSAGHNPPASDCSVRQPQLSASDDFDTCYPYLRAKAIQEESAGTQGHEPSVNDRFTFADFLINRGLGYEAIGVLNRIEVQSPLMSRDPRLCGLRGAARASLGRFAEAESDLKIATDAGDPVAAMWHGYAASACGDWAEARRAFAAGASRIDAFPDVWRARFSAAHALAMLDANDTAAAKNLVSYSLAQTESVGDQLHGHLVQARVDERTGRTDRAHAIYRLLANAPLDALSAPARAGAERLMAVPPAPALEHLSRNNDHFLQTTNLTPSSEAPAQRPGAQSDASSDLTLVPATPSGSVKLEASAPGLNLPLSNTVRTQSGGTIWATEMPDAGRPQLSVSTASKVAFSEGRIVSPVQFVARTNYDAFIDRAEILLFDEQDSNFSRPLAKVSLNPGAQMTAVWDGAFDNSRAYRVGDRLTYLLRVYDAEGARDETYGQLIQLADPRDLVWAGSSTALWNEHRKDISVADLATLPLSPTGLRRQTIPVRGSRIQLQGRGLPSGSAVRLNGAAYAVAPDGSMVAEFLVPIGIHTYDVLVQGAEANAESHRLQLNVDGAYVFMVGLADLTISSNALTKPTGTRSPGEDEDEALSTEGRLAFYLKSRIGGRFLLTAQADTRERELEHLFRGFFTADQRDLFRQLDPDTYYPVFGDDSTTSRDADSAGRLYLKLAWERNHLLFGNYATPTHYTEFGDYMRSLHGGVASFQSSQATVRGEPIGQLTLFASNNETAPGHAEFLGTGGSLYYLRHTNVAPGSERVVVEVRDPTSGRIDRKIALVRGADYDIDWLQGRLILTRPLTELAVANQPSITRGLAIDGLRNFVVVDYEYATIGFDPDNTTLGFRGRQWFGDRLAVGGVYVEENRSGADYALRGADVTLRPVDGLEIRAEHSRTTAASAPNYFSDNGGLTFTPLLHGAVRPSGRATAVRADIDFQALGLTGEAVDAAAWSRSTSQGYSTSRLNGNRGFRDVGAEISAMLDSGLSIFGTLSEVRSGADRVGQGQLTISQRLANDAVVSGEVRYIDEVYAKDSGSGLLAAVQWRQPVGAATEVYVAGQKSLETTGFYRPNDSATLGMVRTFGSRSSVAAEATTGDRGNTLSLRSQLGLNDDHDVYAQYRYSSEDTSLGRYLSDPTTTGWTVGQRSRLTPKTAVTLETQRLAGTGGTTQTNTVGLAFNPQPGLNLGVNLQVGRVKRANLASPFAAVVDRRALSLSAGATGRNLQWQAKIEYRQDTGVEEREQWVVTNALSYRANDSLRIVARANFADTSDSLNALGSARFFEGTVGFALRPVDSMRWAVFGKYTHTSDVSTLPQVSDGAPFYDQNSHIVSLEGTYAVSPEWEVTAKAMRRDGSVRFGRQSGEWEDSGVTLLAGQVRRRMTDEWHALAEYRVLHTTSSQRSGWVVGVDRDVNKHLRVGVGYNFTDQSDDLTRFDATQGGWYLNISGRF